MSSPPTIVGSSAERASPAVNAALTAIVAARIDSPSTISVSSP